jgi:mannose-6-phosphate isomerase-like protein (cupin superfamily)
VYPQFSFIPRNDTVNGKAPASAIWHNGNNTLGSASTPYYVAKDLGPKYLSSADGGFKVIQPLATEIQSGGGFTLSTISMERTNMSAPIKKYPGHAAFEVLEGQLSVTLAAETVDLLQGDVIFIPGNTTFTYGSKIAFTKFLAISQGSGGLATELISKGQSWGSPMWPIA